MPSAKLEDIIVPEIFTPNMIERSVALNAFYQSGVMQQGADIPIGYGKTVELPFYQALTGDDDVWGDKEDIVLNKISMDDDTAVVLTRLKGWASTDLAAALGRDKPLDAIEAQVAQWWAEKMQGTLLQTLNGAMGASNMTSNVLDISGLEGAAANFDGEAFIDAQALLGDRQNTFSAIAVHSSTHAQMKKQDLIEFIPDSDGRPTIPTYMGKRVIEDDDMPVDTSGTDNVYTSYLFASGAVTLVEETPEHATEAPRLHLTNGGTDALINRRKFIMHPRGVRWTPGSGVPAKATPSNAELANSANWTRVWDPKHIPIVQFRHKLAG